MRVIERPDSTTVMIEFPFHIIKDEEEFNHVLSGVDKKDIKVVKAFVDPISFMPKIAFEVNVDVPLIGNQCYRYIATLNSVEQKEALL